jgi:Ribbon-helix-helix protein, copG family
MKRLQIYIDEDVDALLGVRARRQGTSKAALIRQYVAEGIGGQRGAQDPIDALVGIVEGAQDDSASVDTVVYGTRP